MLPLAMFGSGFGNLFFVLLVLAVPIYVVYLLAKITKNTKKEG